MAFEIPPKYQHLVVSFCAVVVLPLAPIFVEMRFTKIHECTSPTLVLTTAIFLVSVFCTSLNFMNLFLSIFPFAYLLMVYSSLLEDHVCLSNDRNVCWAVIICTALFHLVERWNRHVNKEEDFFNFRIKRSS
jgi:hypothetical protein